MVLCSYTFRWADYKRRQDADLTARWFAAWIRFNKEELTCRTSDEGLIVTASPRPQYGDFTRSLRDRAVAGEKLSVAVPPALQNAAAAGQLPEQVAPVRPDEGFIVDPSEVDWDNIDTSGWQDTLARVEPTAPVWQPRPSAIVDQIIAYARSHQHTIPVRIRASRERELLAALRECRAKKRLFESTDRFVHRAILGSWPVMAAILPFTSFSIRLRDESKVYWNGTGWHNPHGALDLSYLSAAMGQEDPSALIELEIDRLFDVLQPFLQPIP